MHHLGDYQKYKQQIFVFITAFSEDKMKQNFKKSSWWYGSVAAAVVCLIGVGAIYTGGFWFTSNDNAAYEAVMDEMSGGAAPASHGSALLSIGS